MYDVTRISYTPGDVLILAVDMDMYDAEDCEKMFDDIRKQAGDVKIVFVPDDLVEEIIHVQKTAPIPYLSTGTTVTNVFPDYDSIKPYLTNCSNSVSTIASDSEEKQW